MSTGEDIHARGLSTTDVDSLRYNYTGVDRGEVTDRLLTVIPMRSRLLDVGCGTGAISQVLRERLDLDFVGLEPNAERSAVGRSRGLDVRTDVLSPQVVAGLARFDVVLFADVLEHLVDPVEILETARLALKPDGMVVASVPNVGYWTIRLNLLLGRFNYQSSGLMDATHLRWFTAASVRRLFEAAGYTVLRYGATAGSLQPIYTQRWPMRHVNHRLRTSMLIFLSKYLPSLFGMQHIVVAKPQNPAPMPLPADAI